MIRHYKIYEAEKYSRKYDPEYSQNLYGICTYSAAPFIINLVSAPQIDINEYRVKFSYYHRLIVVEGIMKNAKICKLVY